MKNQRKPEWLKISLRSDTSYAATKQIVDQHHLHTICSDGRCPNQFECWRRGTATFLIGGNTCTRSCRFCNTQTGRPAPLDPNEPQRVAQSIQQMKLRHAVVTSVDRDDLPDGGAAHWVETIRAIRALTPKTSIEVLIPDFKGDPVPLETILNAAPDIIGHNIETVRRLSPQVRSAADYDRSIKLLNRIATNGARTKSGLMVGLGESIDELHRTIDELYAAGCRMITIGQYLQPTSLHWEVDRYVTPDEFEQLGNYARQVGFTHVASTPLARSSYYAEELNLQK